MEFLYNSILVLLLKKSYTNLETQIIIDDGDKIFSVESFFLLISSFYKNCDETLKLKILEDIFMLINWNNYNSQKIANFYEFLYWILKILFRYQMELFENELLNKKAAVQLI